ncbi:MAG: WcaF family extracellular polysaccharide biosynthesis acetyltransferase [Pseudomonadota bacterium]
MRLDRFDNSTFDRGAPWWKEALWLLGGQPLVASFLPGTAWRRWMLVRFGATIARGVVLKPRLRVKFPWRLKIGEFSWLGEGAWFDNLGQITIGAHCCISQEAYFCTGNHRWDKEGFDLEVGEISVADQAWIGARAVVAPGTQIGKGAVLALGAVAGGVIEGWTIHAGNPARAMKERPRCS